jgi:hypothetical protein
MVQELVTKSAVNKFFQLFYQTTTIPAGAITKVIKDQMTVEELHEFMRLLED